MKHECSIVRDLLPLYVEDMVSEQTAAFVREHLEACPQCRDAHAQCKDPQTVNAEFQPEGDPAPLLKLRRKLAARRIRTALLTAVAVVTVLVCVFAILSAPEFFPYTDDLLEVHENPDGSVTVTFDARVTNYSYSGFQSQDTVPETVCYNIEAWSCTWDRWFSGRGAQSLTIRPERDAPMAVYYAQNNGMNDVLVYEQVQGTDLGGIRSLPRTVLGYYLILMAIVFGALLVLWLFFVQKPHVRVWLTRLLLFPVAYAVGHVVVMGFSFSSYSSQRDLILILAVAALTWCGLLLAHGIFHLCREIRATGGEGSADV